MLDNKLLIVVFPKKVIALNRKWISTVKVSAPITRDNELFRIS